MKLEARQRLMASSSSDNYFDPQVIADKSNTKYKSRDKLIEMKITDFLKIAKPGHDSEKYEQVKRLVDEGINFTSVPYLYYDVEGDKAICTGHEGRHRAKVLYDLGLRMIPVELRGPIRWSEQMNPKNEFDYRKIWPQTLRAEQGMGTIPFPVRREDANKDYK